MEKVIEFPDRSIIEDEATAWVIKMSRDEPPTPEEIKALNAWVAQSAVHKAVFQQMASTWDGLDLLSELRVPGELTVAEKHRRVSVFLWWLLVPLWLVAQLIGSSKQAYNAMTQPRWVLGSAATVLSMGVGLWLLLNQTPGTYITAIGEQSTYTLPDGSSLWLNTNSEINIYYSDSKRRLVLVKGEAHFDVKPDKARPFEVYAGNRRVKAIGTAFSVYLKGRDVDVTVTEGKVDLAVVLAASPTTTATALAGSQTPVAVTRVGTLLAGQGIVIPPDTDKVAASIVHYDKKDLARRVAWKEGRLVFEGEALENVIKEISRYSSLRIEVIGEGVKQISIGGSFPVGELEKLFEALEMGFNVKVVRVSDDHVQLLAKK